MKVCYSCKQKKDESEFARNPARKDGLNSNCRKCHSNYRKDHYEKNRQKYIDKAARNKIAFKVEFAKFKKTLKCSKCSETETCCLDFHHVDSTKKDMAISELVQLGNIERLKTELAKCIVLCANCHRKLHAGIA